MAQTRSLGGSDALAARVRTVSVAARRATRAQTIMGSAQHALGMLQMRLSASDMKAVSGKRISSADGGGCSLAVAWRE